MIVRQTFHRGSEIKDGEEFFDAIPDDPVLKEAIEEVLNMIEGAVPYREFFTLEIDTAALTADVVEAK